MNLRTVCVFSREDQAKSLSRWLTIRFAVFAEVSEDGNNMWRVRVNYDNPQTTKVVEYVKGFYDALSPPL